MNFSSSIFDQVDHFMHDGSTNNTTTNTTNNTTTNTANNIDIDNTSSNKDSNTNNSDTKQYLEVRSSIASTPVTQEIVQGNNQQTFFGNSPNPFLLANQTPNFNKNTGNTPFDHSVNLNFEIEQNQQKTSVVELEAHFDELQKHFENSFAPNSELTFASPNTVPSTANITTDSPHNISNNSHNNINHNSHNSSNNAFTDMATAFKDSSRDKHAHLLEMEQMGMMEGGSPSISPTVEPKSLSNMNTPFLHANSANLNEKNAKPRNTSLSINTLPSPALKSIKATPDMTDTKMADNNNHNGITTNSASNSIDNITGSGGSSRLDSPSSVSSSGYKRPSKSKTSSALNNSRKVTKNSPLQKPKKSPMIRSNASASMSKKFSNYSIKSNPVMSFNNNNNNNNGSANSNRSSSIDHAAGPGDWDEMFALPASSLPNEHLHANNHMNGYTKDPSMSPFTSGVSREERNFSKTNNTAGIKIILPSSASEGSNSVEADRATKDVAVTEGEFSQDKKLQTKKFGFSGSPLLNMNNTYSADRSSRQKEHGVETTVLRATESPVLRARKSASLTPLMGAKRASSLEGSNLNQQQGSSVHYSKDYCNKQSSQYMNLTSNPDPMQMMSNDLRETDTFGYQSRTSSVEKLPAASAFHELKKTTSNGNPTGKQVARKSSESSNSSNININNNNNNDNSLGHTAKDVSYPHINDHDSKELFPHGKKEVHKEAEKGRRERLNNALAELGTLIPIELRATMKVPSKATTVELACEHIRQLTEKVKKYEGTN